jgi:hypothetical protein
MAFWQTVWMSSHRSGAVRTLRLRLKDRHTARRCALARELNTMFNYCSVPSEVTRGERAVHLPVQAVRKSGGARRALCSYEYKCADAGVCWQCPVCEAVHDRNVNAAHNILAAGHRRLAEGILALDGEEDVKRDTIRQPAATIGRHE